MRKFWLIFAQAATVFLAMLFIVTILKPHWLPFTFSANEKQRPYDNFNWLTRAPLSYSPATQRAAPAVVSVYTTKTTQENDTAEKATTPYHSSHTSSTELGLGSGVIVHEKGYILTNHHVVEAASEILVALPDGRQSQATIVGIDEETDLALLKIEMDRLPIIPLGDSDSLQVGDVVLAIGNPFGVGQTVTSGIISALSRNGMGVSTFENFIQTDAAVNPGNSGGALINTRGELIGINTAIFSRTGGNLGISFAIPVNSAKSIGKSLVKYGKVTRGWIGIESRELTPELINLMNIKTPSGVLITGVLSTGPAAQTGLQPGDVILKIGEQPIINTPQLLNTVAALTPGHKTSITIERSGSKQSLDITPIARPNMAQQ